jgi:carboxypeptidase PM20D1
MKTLLFRVLLAVLVVSGLLTAVLYARAALQRPRELPAVAALPLELDAAGALDRLVEAVRIAPTGDSAAVDFAEHLAATFPAAHAALSREEPARAAFLYTWEGSDPSLSPILLSFHSIPAPVGSGAGEWRFPPFSGEVAEGAVWGRGTLAGPGPLLAAFEAVEALVSAGYAPARTVLLAVGGAAEDARGLAAIAEVLEAREIRAEWVLGDGGAIAQGLLPGVTEPIAVVGTAETGALTLRLAARGPGGPATASAGASPVARLAEALARLEEPGFSARIQGPTRDLLSTLAPRMDPGTRMLAANLWLFERPLARALSRNPWFGATLRTVATPTSVRADGAPEALPLHATAQVRVGVAPWDDPGAILDEIWALLGDLEIEVLPGPSGEPTLAPSAVSSAEAEGFAHVRDAARAAFPDLLEVLPGTVPGATDARPFASVARDSYRFVPFRMDAGALASLRGPNERIPVPDYVAMIRFYGELIRRGSERAPRRAPGSRAGRARSLRRSPARRSE